MEASPRLSPHTPFDTHALTQHKNWQPRHCEERSDEAIHLSPSRGMDCFAALAMTLESPANLVSVLVLRHQRNRRLQQNEEVEQHRPVLDIIQIELDALLDLL